MSSFNPNVPQFDPTIDPTTGEPWLLEPTPLVTPMLNPATGEPYPPGTPMIVPAQPGDDLPFQQAPERESPDEGGEDRDFPKPPVPEWVPGMDDLEVQGGNANGDQMVAASGETGAPDDGSGDNQASGVSGDDGTADGGDDGDSN